MEEGEEDGDDVVGEPEQPGGEQVVSIFFSNVEIFLNIINSPGGEEVVELAAQRVTSPGHVANLEKVSLTSKFESEYWKYTYESKLSIFDNLKSEATNEPDEDCEKVGHGENQDQHCKLTIPKPVAKK